MSKFRARRAPVLLLCLILAAGAGLLVWRLAPVPPEEAPPGWTVMVYMVGSDLESFDGLATLDLKEMRASVRDDTTLLVMTGGCPAAEGSLFGDDCRLYRITGGGDELLDTVSGGMGDPATLSRMLKAGAAMAQGPAMLVFWDDGYGPIEGFGNDTRTPDDRRLTLDEIAQALRENGFDRRPLTVIGFDACLMSGCETAVTLAPYARYLLASQETVPPEGLDYGFLAALAPEADGEAAGRAVIASFTAFYDAMFAKYPGRSQPCTLALTDLSGSADLADAVGALMGEMQRDVDEGRFPDISALRQDVWQYGRVLLDTEYDIVDLKQLARSAAAAHPEAEAVLTAMDRCVIHRGGNRPEAGGLSVFFPQLAAEEHTAVWLDRVNRLPLPEAWRSFLIRYDDALRNGPPPGTASPVPEDVFGARLDDTALRDFVRAKYYVLEGTMEDGMRLLRAGSDWSLEDHTVTVRWNRQLVRLRTDGDSVPLVTFPVQADDEKAYFAGYAVALTGMSPIRIRLNTAMDRKTGAWSALSAVPVGAEPESGRREVRLDQVDTILFYSAPSMPAYNDNGQLLPWTDWPAAGSSYPEYLDVTEGFTISETPLPETGGPYWLQIVITDTYNRQYSAGLVPLD